MDRNQLFPLEKVKFMVDLWVRFDNNLTSSDHISEENNKAYSVRGIIKRNFIYMDERTEKIQKRATILVIKLKNKSYIDILI